MINSHMVSTLAVTALAAFIVYRRARRNIGRQSLQPRRLTLRIAFLSLAGLLVLGSLGLLHVPTHVLEALAAAALAGALAGAALGLFGLRHTNFEFTPEGNFYTPHLYIGLTVTFLLVARMAYRLVQLNTLGAVDIAGRTPPPMLNSPLTLGVLFLTLGYYIAYGAGLLHRLRSHSHGATASTPAV